MTYHWESSLPKFWTENRENGRFGKKYGRKIQHPGDSEGFQGGRETIGICWRLPDDPGGITCMSYLSWIYGFFAVSSSPEHSGSQSELEVYASSGICPSVRHLSTIIKDLSSETTWPIRAKFHVEHQWREGTQSAKKADNKIISAKFPKTVSLKILMFKNQRLVGKHCRSR